MTSSSFLQFLRLSPSSPAMATFPPSHRAVSVAGRRESCLIVPRCGLRGKGRFIPGMIWKATRKLCTCCYKCENLDANSKQSEWYIRSPFTSRLF